MGCARWRRQFRRRRRPNDGCLRQDESYSLTKDPRGANAGKKKAERKLNMLDDINSHCSVATAPR